jgi:hypothetical protein
MSWSIPPFLVRFKRDVFWILGYIKYKSISSKPAAMSIVQLGSNIVGEATGDFSGQSVSLSSDGTIVAIGAYYNHGNDGMDSNSGQVRVYERDSSGEWTPLGGDIDGEAANDYSGWSVSLSSDGTKVAIGAYGNGTNSGHVRVYEYSVTMNVWTPLGGDIDGEADSDYSGYSVSLSSDGTKVAIGAIRNDGNDGVDSNSGHVRVYGYDSGTWTPLGGDIDGEAANDYSGCSVSLSSDGTKVAIGAKYADVGSGHVRVYEYDMGAWTPLGGDIDGVASYDSSGWSVSLSSDGTMVAIGAPRNDDGIGGTNSGHVRVWRYDSGGWTQVGGDIDGEDAGDQLGYSVSLSSDGTMVAIGSYIHDSNRGHVRVYGYGSTSGIWTQLGEDIDGDFPNDRSGWSVSLSSDSTTVAIGATDHPDGTGYVKVYNILTGVSSGDPYITTIL